MKKSKYLNKQFGMWTCVKVNVSYVQPVFLKGSKERSARPHHQTYSYVMEAHGFENDLLVEINSKQAAKMLRGEYDPIAKLLAKHDSACITVR